MTKIRIWHLLVVVAAMALLFVVKRYDCPCTPLAPILAGLYLCGVPGMLGARRKGRTARRGLLLGPLGVLIAFSNPIPEEWKAGYPPARDKPGSLAPSSPGDFHGESD